MSNALKRERAEENADDLAQRVQKLNGELNALRQRVADQEQELQSLYASKSWKVTAPLRFIAASVRGGDASGHGKIAVLRSLARTMLSSTRWGREYLRQRSLGPDEKQYQLWLQSNQIGAAKLAEYAAESQKLGYRPIISVLMPVYDPPITWLDRAIRSVRQQAYPYWELCLADDASKNEEVRALLGRHAREDSRIKVCYREVNGHISESSNSALQLATGEYVALLDHDDELAPDALFVIARALNQDPSIDMLYSNEDKIDGEGRRCQPTFKPQWSPDYFLSFMYIGHLSVYRRRLVLEAGRFRRGFEGSQDYDLALRVSEQAKKVAHVPEILYHWRMHEESVAANIHAKPYAFQSGQKALTEALMRREQQPAEVKTTRHPGIYRMHCALAPSISAALILLPSEAAEHEKIFCRLVPASLRSSVTLVPPPAAGATISATLQSALRGSAAQYFIIADADLRFIENDGLVELLSQLGRNGIAAVGPKILDASQGTVLNAGYSVANGKLASNGWGESRLASGYANRLVSLSNVSVLSSRCMAFRRDALGDPCIFDHDYMNLAAFDVDLSRTLARSGRLLATPYSEVSLDRSKFERMVDLRVPGSDWARLVERHGMGAFEDPFFPAGLDAENVRFRFVRGG